MTYCQNNCVRVCLRLSSFFLSSDLWILEAAYSTGGVACKVWREKAKAGKARKGGGNAFYCMFEAKERSLRISECGLRI